MTMYRVAELFKEAGLPDGVFNIVNGTADVVNGLCDHPLVQVGGQPFLSHFLSLSLPLPLSLPLSLSLSLPLPLSLCLMSN